MNKYLLTLLLAFLVLPFGAFAANEVSITEDTNVYIADSAVTLILKTGTKVDVMAVSSSSIVFTMSPGGNVSLTSADKKTLSNTWGYSTYCGDTISILTIPAPTTAAQDVTVTIGATCTTQSTGGGGGGGGGGGAAATSATTTGTTSASATSGGSTTATTNENTSAIVVVPAGAVTSDTTFTITPTIKGNIAIGFPTPSGLNVVGGYAYSLSASTGGVFVTSFSSPITLTLTYTETQVAGINEGTLGIYRWNGTQWVALTSTVNTATNTITATTTNFSYFAIMGQSGTTTTTPIGQMTREQLIAEISRIAALIAQLQTELANMLGTTSGTFASDLYYGIKGSNEVKKLQNFLITKGYLKGTATGNYLSLTVAAVKAYQTAKGITPVNGRCGPKTRAAVNADL